MRLLICLLAFIDLSVSQSTNCVKFKHTARSEAHTMVVQIIADATSQPEESAIATNDFHRFDMGSFSTMVMTADQEDYTWFMDWTIGLTYDETFPLSDEAKCTSVPVGSNPGSCTEGGCCRTTIQAYATYTDTRAHIHLKARTNIRDENGDHRFWICEQEFEQVAPTTTTPLTTQFSEPPVGCMNPIDECELGIDHCCHNSYCEDKCEGYLCVCDDGYEGDGIEHCEDIDECAEGTHVCSINAACENTGGSYVCECNAGYAGDGTTCIDIDECTEGTYECGINAACENTLGSYICVCNEGYEGDGTTCIAVCTYGCYHGSCNSPNYCTCEPEWQGTSCNQDVNECLINHGCSVNGYCQNTVGSYNCFCNYGYTGDGWTCTDVNECISTTTNDCSDDGTCTNLPGSHKCSCNSGYEGSGYICVDIDECLLVPWPCEHHTYCTNSIGSYTCTDCVECSGTQTYTDAEGCITSGNFGDNYYVNTDCYMTINVPSGRVQLEILEMDLEYENSCAYDYLEIKDGSNSRSTLLGKHCGTPGVIEVTSSSTAMYLHFHSDDAITRPGFKIKWSSV